MILPQQARLLLAKAAEDLTALRLFADRPELSDLIWGFHAQQAVEKALKARLAWWEVPFPFTHRLYELADLLEDHAHCLDDEFEPLLALTRYAVELRYALLEPGESRPLHRSEILRLVDRLFRETERIVGTP